MRLDTRSNVLTSARVLVVAPQPFYEDRGTPIAVRQLLHALSQLSYEVDVLTYPVGRSIEIPRVRYFRLPNLLRLRRVPVGFSLRKVLLDAVMAPALFERLRRGGYACVHAVEEAAFLAVLLGRRFRVPVIYDMQSSLPEQLAQHAVFRGRAAQSLLHVCERWLLSRADSVISSSGLAARVRSQAPGARLREWRYASPLPLSAPAESERLRQELGIGPGQPVVLYSGTFEGYQGLPELLAAIPLVRRAAPRAVFVLVGAEEAGGTAIVRDHGALVRAGALRVIRRQPRELIPRYLALADVAVSPRAWGDNLPLKIFDYLAAGKPIVATDIPAHRALLDESRAEFCAATAAELAAAISRLLGDRARAGRLAAAGRAYAEEQLGWHAFVDAVGDLYREVNRASR